MNKKNLSVVMAGAMLATSVAPVLADTTTEKPQTEFTVNNSNKGLLIKELRNFINSKFFASVSENEDFGGKSVNYVKYDKGYQLEKATVKNGTNHETLIAKINDLSDKYGIDKTTSITIGYNETKVVRSNGYYDIVVDFGANNRNANSTVKVLAKEFDNSNIDLLETVIQKSTNGDVFEVWDRGSEEKNGKYYEDYSEDVYEKLTYTDAQLKALAEDWENETGDFSAYNKETKYEAVYDMEYYNGVLTVTYRKALDEEKLATIPYKAGDTVVNFEEPINEDKEVVTDKNSSTIVGFAEKKGRRLHRAGDDIEDTKLYTVTISDVDYNYTTTLSKLYDGLFLTEDGQELLNTMESYDAKYSDGWRVSGENTINDEMNGIYSMVITFTKPVANGNTEKQTVKITTNDREKLEIFANGIKVKTAETNTGTVRHREFPVEVLAGSNRYETAVKVAKENADTRTVAENGNIVLVNGNSLVDGLAAAPLAATVQNLRDNGRPSSEDYVAPILLTSRDGLDATTKAYMKEIIGQQRIMNLDKVTVYLVGGEAVISKAVENDLKEIGFRVVRAGGEDREATSVAVAELMRKDGSESGDNAVDLENAFLVGANGEADAMSIAAKAAENGTPIIVESVHGIKEDTINYLKGYKNDQLKGKDVTIIGGETAVSKATEKELTDAKLSVQRVAGSNRQATNAKVMNMYYRNGSVKKYVVSKDGINNKSELIDALTATSLAAKYHSPIVLGTNKLSNDQINAIELKAQKTGVYVYQVGYGVARDVVKTIADRVGLAK